MLILSHWIHTYEGNSILRSLNVLRQVLALAKRGSCMVSHSLSHNSRFLYRSSQLRSTQGMNSLIKRLDRKRLSYLKHNRTCTWMDFEIGAFLFCFVSNIYIFFFGFMHPPPFEWRSIIPPSLLLLFIIPLSFNTVILASVLFLFFYICL